MRTIRDVAKIVYLATLPVPLTAAAARLAPLPIITIAKRTAAAAAAASIAASDFQG
jgi:hypothetical protein